MRSSVTVATIAAAVLSTGVAIVHADTSQDSAPSRPGFTSFDGVQVSYFEYGPSADEAPTIVFTGGWPTDSSKNEPFAHQMAAKYHVVRYDQRGAGASDHPTAIDKYSLENLAGEFGAVIDATAPGHPVHVFGEAWGAFIASEYAHLHPEGRVAPLTSVGAPSVDMWLNAMRRAAIDPAKYPQLAAQLAALSYWAVLQPEWAPETVIGTGLPTIGINIYTDVTNGDWDALRNSDLTREPTNVYDTSAGVNKYRALVRDRVLYGSHYDYLPIPQVRLFQLDGDWIEADLAVDGLEQRTPHLVKQYVPGSHFQYMDVSGDQIRAGVEQAIRETDPNPK